MPSPLWVSAYAKMTGMIACIEAPIEFMEYQSQMHDADQTRSDWRKDAETVCFDRKTTPYTFSSGDLVVLYQERAGKLEPR